MMRKVKRKKIKHAESQNILNLVPDALKFRQVPKEEWPETHWDPKRIQVFLSPHYLVQVFDADRGYLRISINRVQVKKHSAGWADRITWDDLWMIKSVIGYGDRCAVEVYPRENDLVNVANMRHLWVLPGNVRVGWTNDNISEAE